MFHLQLRQRTAELLILSPQASNLANQLANHANQVRVRKTFKRIRDASCYPQLESYFRTLDSPTRPEICPGYTRLFLPNDRAIEPQIAAIYRRFGLNDRQIEILARATPKRDYYCQSRRGNRLFELGLGEVALAFTAASSKTDQAAIASVLAEHGRDGFAAAWLRHKGLDWAADLLVPNQDRQQKLIQPALEVTR